MAGIAPGGAGRTAAGSPFIAHSVLADPIAPNCRGQPSTSDSGRNAQGSATAPLDRAPSAPTSRRPRRVRPRLPVRRPEAGCSATTRRPMIETLARRSSRRPLFDSVIERACRGALRSRGSGAALPNAVRAPEPGLYAAGRPASMSSPRDDRRGPRLERVPSAGYLTSRSAGVPTAVNGVAMSWTTGERVDSWRASRSAPSPLVRSRLRIQRSRRRPFERRTGSDGRSARSTWMLHDGSWFSPMRQALDAYVDKSRSASAGWSD